MSRGFVRPGSHRPPCAFTSSTPSDLEYTAENPAPMFERLERQGIGWLDYNVIEPLLNEMQEKGAIELEYGEMGVARYCAGRNRLHPRAD